MSATTRLRAPPLRFCLALASRTLSNNSNKTKREENEQTKLPKLEGCGRGYKKMKFVTEMLQGGNPSSTRLNANPFLFRRDADETLLPYIAALRA